jgi:iron-sulfur cluster-binding protein
LDKKVLQAQTIKAEAARLGFSACGLARAERVDQTQEARFRKWIAEGKHGEMDYLARNIEKRMDPRLLVEGALTIVVVAMNYQPAHLPEKPPLARYAYGKDYHDVVRERLLALMQSLNLKPFEDGRAFVDTAPVDERYWAVKAGLGWTGRNGQLIIPRAGSYFFLGELILVHPADAYDSPKRNLCGNCRACVDACPAGALCGDGSMDARKCLSYLTIEHRGPLSEEAGEQMGDCFYGCDRCAEVCPWNRFARPTQEAAFAPSAELLRMKTEDWRTLDVETYRRLFKGSAVKRAKYEGLKRNINAWKP